MRACSKTPAHVSLHAGANLKFPNFTNAAASFIAAFLLIIPGFGKTPGKLAKDLNGRGNIDVIVQFRTTVGDAQNAKLKGKGGQLKHAFKSLKAGIYTIPSQVLDALSDDPDVTFISPANRHLTSSLDITTATVGAAMAQSYNWTGAGVGIAVVDSGVDEGDFSTASW